jgi:hypothetical protein
MRKREGIEASENAFENPRVTRDQKAPGQMARSGMSSTQFFVAA